MVLELSKIFPTSDVWALVVDGNAHDKRLSNGLSPRSTWAKFLPWKKSKALLAISSLLVYRCISIKKYDVVISSSHTFSHHAKFIGSRNAIHLNYVYTPARSLWVSDIDNRGKKFVDSFMGSMLKKYDRSRAQKSNSTAVISSEIQKRVFESWNVPSDIIYPFCDLENISDYKAKPSQNSLPKFDGRPYLVTAGRLVGYKKHDFALRLAGHMQLPIIVMGNGPELESLQRLALELGVEAHFEVAANRDAWLKILDEAKAFIMAGVEDFGITPIESIALGTPVFALNRGGSCEYVIDGINGKLIEELDLSRFESEILMFNYEDFSSCVEKFGRERFSKEIISWVNRETVKKFGENI